MKEKDYFTTTELAKILGISRIAVFKKIKSGEIKAIRVGRVFAIPKAEFEIILGKTLSADQKKVIDEGIKKTIREYGTTLKMLGNE